MSHCTNEFVVDAAEVSFTNANDTISHQVRHGFNKTFRLWILDIHEVAFYIQQVLMELSVLVK